MYQVQVHLLDVLMQYVRRRLDHVTILHIFCRYQSVLVAVTGQTPLTVSQTRFYHVAYHPVV